MLGNNFGKSQKEHSLKIDTNFMLQEEQGGSSKALGSASISGAGVTTPNESQRLLYGFYLNHGYGSEIIIITLVVVHKHSFPSPHPYEFHSASMDEVPKTLRKASKYGFYVWDSQELKAIGEKRDESSSKNTSHQERKRAECQDGDDFEIVKVPVTDRADATSIENSIAVRFRVFNMSDYHQKDLFVRVEQTENPDIPLRDVKLSHVPLLCASFRMYLFYYSRETLSVTFHHRVSAEYVTTLSTACTTVGHQALNNGAKVILLDGRHRTASMRKLRV